MSKTIINVNTENTDATSLSVKQEEMESTGLLTDAESTSTGTRIERLSAPSVAGPSRSSRESYKYI